MKHPKQLIALLITGWAAFSFHAQAHFSLLDSQALEGSTKRFVMKTSHGCDGEPTTAVKISFPDGIQSVKPMPKPGWTLTIERKELEKPYILHGKTITSDVSAIIWSKGSLPDGYYDEFVFQAMIHRGEGTTYLPVEQTCGLKTVKWDTEDQTSAHPAPMVHIDPSVHAGHLMDHATHK